MKPPRPQVHLDAATLAAPYAIAKAAAVEAFVAAYFAAVTRDVGALPDGAPNLSALARAAQTDRRTVREALRGNARALDAIRKIAREQEGSGT